jgi:uncharacterized protein (TIGR03083 family)
VTTDDRRLELVAGVTAAFADEIERHRPDAAVPWPWWPDVRTLVGHLGGVHAWAARVVRTGERVPDPVDRPVEDDDAMRRWYVHRRADLLDALRTVPVDTPCWAIASGTRTAAFWRRRTVFETTKHLIDLRAAGGLPRRAPDELAPADYADGVDELLEVFLPRSRPTLDALPEPVLLQAADVDRRWRIGRDWTVTTGTPDDDAVRIRADAADLALLVWQRADLGDPERFEITGDRGTAGRFATAPVHP